MARERENFGLVEGLDGGKERFLSWDSVHLERTCQELSHCTVVAILTLEYLTLFLQRPGLPLKRTEERTRVVSIHPSLRKRRESSMFKFFLSLTDTIDDRVLPFSTNKTFLFYPVLNLSSKSLWEQTPNVRHDIL